MPEVKEEPEQSRLVGVSITDLLNPKFAEELEKIDPSIQPAAILLVSPKDNKLIPISLSHQNAKEQQDKVLHINCPDVEMFNKIKKIVKEI